jgi:ABC-type enterochelin transport system permease subunit
MGGQKNMKNKLVSILICVMMLVIMLPSTVLATTITSDQQTTPSVIGYTNVFGFVLYRGISDNGKTLHFFALKLRYSTISISGERSMGVIVMEPVAIPSPFIGYLGHIFIYGSFFGWFNP